jgi:hypothetical protein
VAEAVRAIPFQNGSRLINPSNVYSFFLQEVEVMMNRILLFAFIAVFGAGTAFADIDATIDGARGSTATVNAVGSNSGDTATVQAAALLDSFNRADGPIGAQWTNQAGSFVIKNKVAMGGAIALATYNGAASDVLEADIQATGTALQYVGLVLGYADVDNNYLLKVQQQAASGKFDHAGCYYGNNISGFGLGFFTLDAAFAKAHMKVVLDGSTVTMTFSNIDGGTGTQTYVCTGAPASGGSGIGIASYTVNYGSIDNFSVAPTQYFDVISIADINSDGVTDQAVLAMKAGNYYLRTIDGATGTQVKQVALGPATNITPSALTSVGQEISVLITKSTGIAILQLRDSTTLALVKTLTLPTK